MSSRLTDEKLWSWIDRDAPELSAHLAVHPQDLERAQALRREVEALRSSLSGPPQSLPAKLGNYHLKRLLGWGGMGSVYKAEEEVSGRRVAVKVLRGDPGPREKLYQGVKLLKEAAGATRRNGHRQ